MKKEGGLDRAWCAACNRFVFGRFSVGVGGFLLHEGRVLFVQRGKEPGRGRWTFPGGFLEADEAADDGLAREVREETGLRVAAEGLLVVRHAQTDAEQNVYCVYGLTLAGPIGDLMDGGDGDEVSRVVLANAIDNANGGVAALEKALAMRCGTTCEGTTRWSVWRAAQKCGFPDAVCRRMSLEEMERTGSSAIVSIATLPGINHAALYVGTFENLVILVDPQYGKCTMPRRRFREVLYGNPIVLAPSASRRGVRCDRVGRHGCRAAVGQTCAP